MGEEGKGIGKKKEKKREDSRTRCEGRGKKGTEGEQKYMIAKNAEQPLSLSDISLCIIKL